MVDPATALLCLTISDTDFMKLKAGFEPANMDDRWAISAADSDDERTTTITLTQSSTGEKHYILAVKSRGRRRFHFAIKRCVQGVLRKTTESTTEGRTVQYLPLVALA
jgi:hypothetical protein